MNLEMNGRSNVFETMKKEAKKVLKAMWLLDSEIVGDKLCQNLRKIKENHLT